MRRAFGAALAAAALAMCAPFGAAPDDSTRGEAGAGDGAPSTDGAADGAAGDGDAAAFAGKRVFVTSQRWKGDRLTGDVRAGLYRGSRAWTFSFSELVLLVLLRVARLVFCR